MGTAMDNEKQNQNQNNRKSEPEQNSSQENIPLWLQGLDNTEEEDKGGVTNESQSEGSWTKELDDTQDDDRENDQQPEKILPDWLSTLSDVEPEMPKIMENQKAEEPNAMPEKNKSEKDNVDADEITEKVEIKNISPENVYEPKDSPVEDNFSDEGFLEISEMDLTEEPEPEPEQLVLDESLSQAEELPYWLKDMIVEQPGESYPHKAMTYAEIVALSKEDTKPIRVSDETEVPAEETTEDELSEVEHTHDSAEALELDETTITEEPEAIEEPVQPEPEPDEVPASFIGDDTKPVRPHPEISENQDEFIVETDQQETVEEEAATADQSVGSSQIQEDSDELIEIDSDQWVEKGSEQVLKAESEPSAPWPEQEPVEEEAEASSQWLELDVDEEEAESKAPSQWPEQEPAVKETALEAPEQWLEEPVEPESEPEGLEDLPDQEELKEETEPAVEVESISHEAIEEHIVAEETEEIKVKDSDQKPEAIQEQTEFKQPADLGQEQQEAVLKPEQELPIIQKTEALPEDVQIPQEETERPGGTPKTLRFAKYLLDQGDFDRAKEIFKPYIENNEFIEDIEAWLIEASNNGAKKHSGTWELIGDIAMVQNQPSRAFEAYKQAITVLLSTKKETNETD